MQGGSFGQIQGNMLNPLQQQGGSQMTQGQQSSPATFTQGGQQINLPQQQQPRTRQAQSLGSGVIVNAKEGLVLTNNHVIQRADEITVSLHDGRTFQAEVVGSDPATDVAVIRIPPEKLTALPLADSDRLRVGDFVVAIGNPFGLGGSVSVAPAVQIRSHLVCTMEKPCAFLKKILSDAGVLAVLIRSHRRFRFGRTLYVLSKTMSLF